MIYHIYVGQYSHLYCVHSRQVRRDARERSVDRELEVRMAYYKVEAEDVKPEEEDIVRVT